MEVAPGFRDNVTFVTALALASRSQSEDPDPSMRAVHARPTCRKCAAGDAPCARTAQGYSARPITCRHNSQGMTATWSLAESRMVPVEAWWTQSSPAARTQHSPRMRRGALLWGFSAGPFISNLQMHEQPFGPSPLPLRAADNAPLSYSIGKGSLSRWSNKLPPSQCSFPKPVLLSIDPFQPPSILSS